jgi:hypothetical protein
LLDDDTIVEDMIRQTVARVDLGALTSNYRHIVEYLAHDGGARTPGVIAVVKANAYGHGAGQVARALERAAALQLLDDLHAAGDKRHRDRQVPRRVEKPDRNGHN